MAIQPSIISKKKKILILVSHGGGGHKTAGESLKEILGTDYHIEINPVIEDILGSMDYLNQLTRGHFTGEDLYNFLLQRHQKKLLEWMLKYGSYHMRPKRIEKTFEKYLLKTGEKPDLIISPTPYINYGVACAASRWDIPFLILPTDLDGSTFMLGFPEQGYPHHFKVGLAYDDPELQKTTLRNCAIRPDQMVVTGFPVRPACLKRYTAHDLLNIRAKHHLFEAHQTVSLMMGAMGGNLIFEHFKSLSIFDPRAHQIHLQINICTGHNQQIETKIHRYLSHQGARSIREGTWILPTGLVIHVRPFTEDIIELMAASNIIITKTGSCTVNESIYLGKKLLLDNTKKSTARFLWWEQFNIPFVQKYGLGCAFSDSKQLLMLIPSLLKYPEKKECTLHLPNFRDNIINTVREMIR